MPKEKLIDTPYGRKPPELLCKAMDVHTTVPEVVAFLRDAEKYLELLTAHNTGDTIPGRALTSVRAAIDKLEATCK